MPAVIPTAVFPGRSSRWPVLVRLALPAFLGVTALLLLSCASQASSRKASTATDWSVGPVRWLLQPNELRAYRRLSSHQDRLDFIEQFWRRRDPSPEESGNAFAETFFQRVAAADRIYSEGPVRGSLTDRGRAFVLLGPPELLRYTRRAVPTWDPARSRNRLGSDVRQVRVEIWGFGPTNLSPAMARQVEFDENGFVTISFVEEGEHTRLVDGEDLLRLAARFALREREDD